MTEEQAAGLRYEAGMYQSLYEVAKARIEALEREYVAAAQAYRARIETLEASLREIEHLALNKGIDFSIRIQRIARAALDLSRRSAAEAGKDTEQMSDEDNSRLLAQPMVCLDCEETFTIGEMFPGKRNIDPLECPYCRSGKTARAALDKEAKQ